jgi:type I restriction enzyme, S subunit
MELKPGYKQTEVGMIPEDWEVIPLIGCLSSTPNYGINAPAVPYSDRLPAYIRITDISEDGQFLSHNPVSVKSINSAKYLLSDGDIVFARTGASVGKSYRYKLADGLLVFAGFLIRVHPDPTKVLSSFVAAYVTTGNYWRWVSLMSMRSGQPGINGKEYSLLPIPKPSLPEQRSIATALSDMDELLGGLDRLITKKRDLKRSAMQQLITGKTRLSGFGEGKNYKQTEIGLIPEDWEVVSLGSCLLTRPDYGINAPAVPYSDRLPTYIRITDITEDGHFLTEAPVSVKSVNAKNYFLSDGDIVLARTGASVGKSYRYKLTDGSLVFAGFLIRIRPDIAKLLPSFVAAYVTTGSYWRWVRLMSMRSGQPGINGNEYSLLPIPKPSLPEQTAIASILSDMDTEIATLEQRRNKTRDLKQAMMQELLTGRIRLL